MKTLWESWKRARQKRWVRWGADGLIFLAVLMAITAWQTRHLVESGEAAPAFQLRDLDGKTWSSAELQGKPVVLYFWAPWCGVCKAESSAISSLRKAEEGDAHVISIAVAYDDVEEVKRFVRDHGVDYPVLLGNDAVRRAFQVNQFPTTYFLSSDGKVKRAAVGYTTGFGLRWRTWF